MKKLTFQHLNLIFPFILQGITAELVDSLENTVNGKPVSPEYIQNICYKLFNTQLKQTIDFTRPGTAGDYIRKSLAYQKSYAVPYVLFFWGLFYIFEYLI